MAPEEAGASKAGRPQAGAWGRDAHSLIELLVVLIIVSILIAIIVPAVQRAREAARMAQCINHQAQLAKAIHMHVADEPYGRFPGYRAFAADGTTQIGWAPQVFEYLGRSDLPAEPTQGTYIEALVCPSNQGPTDSPRLNYVVNGGQAGIDSPADGIFFDHAKPERIYITKDDFLDGLTNTIMLAENLDATRWDVTDEANQCILWPLVEGNEINEGEGSRPSSHHPGGFVTAFADGSVRFMSETDINDDPAPYSDGSIYVSLLTPGGDDSPEPETNDQLDPCDPPEDASGTVGAALDWIVRHQFSDGHWSFAHSSHPDCNGQCSHDGTVSTGYKAATSLALLPLMGLGNTVHSGQYRDEVCKGVAYLMAVQNPTNGSLWDENGGHMYSHLIAHLTLAEALLLGERANAGGCDESGTGSDPCDIDLSELREAVERATQYTIGAQAPYVDDGTLYRKGGWRYFYDATGWGTGANASGCISNTIWAVMALVQSKKAGIDVPQETFDRIQLFLDHNEYPPMIDDTSSGRALGRYGYNRGIPTTNSFVTNDPSPGRTLLGLLGRAYLGTSPTHPAIQQFTANELSVPAIQDYSFFGDIWYTVYYTMHGTQLMYLAKGEQWDAWQSDLRDLLQPTQETVGHQTGSWDKDDTNSQGGDAVNGGRLYTTVMYTLSLERVVGGLQIDNE